jgi:hypothetical protein
MSGVFDRDCQEYYDMFAVAAPALLELVNSTDAPAPSFTFSKAPANLLLAPGLTLGELYPSSLAEEDVIHIDRHLLSMLAVHVAFPDAAAPSDRQLASMVEAIEVACLGSGGTDKKKSRSTNEIFDKTLKKLLAMIRARGVEQDESERISKLLDGTRLGKIVQEFASSAKIDSPEDAVSGKTMAEMLKVVSKVFADGSDDKELLRETMDFLSKLTEGGSGDGAMEMIKNLMSKLGGGKGGKASLGFLANLMGQAQKTDKTKDRMRKKLEDRKKRLAGKAA